MVCLMVCFDFATGIVRAISQVISLKFNKHTAVESEIVAKAAIRNKIITREHIHVSHEFMYAQ